VRKTNIFLRDERDARRTTRGEASEREVRLMSTRSRMCIAGPMLDPARGWEGLVARTPAHIFRHRASRRESVESEACFKGFDVFARRARGRALHARLLPRRPNARKPPEGGTNVGTKPFTDGRVFRTHPPTLSLPSAGTSCPA
jgi:hypothetical protein